MPLFSSNRERRLWIWTLVVLVAIYSTVVLASKLSGALREHGLLGAGFALGLLLVASAVVTLGLRARPGGLEIAVAIAAGTAYMMVLLRMAIPEERTHLIEFSLVGTLIYAALTERASNGHRVPVPAILAVLATAMLGWIDEGIQALLPGRVYDIRDIAFNALAGLMAVASSAALGAARRWHRRRRG